MRVAYNPVFTGMSGRLGGLVFYRWKGRPCARRHIVPPNPRTEKQQANRAAFAELAGTWNRLPGEVKESWREYARRKRMTGYNAFIKANMERQKQGNALCLRPEGGSGRDAGEYESSSGPGRNDTLGPRRGTALPDHDPAAPAPARFPFEEDPRHGGAEAGHRCS